MAAFQFSEPHLVTEAHLGPCKKPDGRNKEMLNLLDGFMISECMEIGDTETEIESVWN